MAQKITIKIATRSYMLTVVSPEQEELVRLAAEEITKKYDASVARFTGKDPADILAFLALNECRSKLSLQREIDGLKQAEASLAEDVGNYLKKI